MSMGPLGGIAGSAAGAPLAQTKGSETDRAAQDAAVQRRQVQNDQHAADVAGVGQTEQDEEAGDRDADGRRLLERSAASHDEPEAVDESKPDDRLSIDPTGQSGSQLDLTG